MKTLVACGLTPLEVLERATRESARALKGLDEFGTIAVGKRADLLLVAADPTEAIANASTIKGVMVRGRWLSHAELRQKLDGLPQAYAREEQWLCAILKQDPDQALQYLDENDPFNHLATPILSRVRVEWGATELARTLQEVKRIRAKSILVEERTLNALGRRLLAKTRNKDAITVLGMCIDSYPRSAYAHDALARAYAADGDTRRAADHYNKALALDPLYSNAQGARAFLKKFANMK
jgi:tetratricopeptide (TPR) repeat protein